MEFTFTSTSSSTSLAGSLVPNTNNIATATAIGTQSEQVGFGHLHDSLSSSQSRPGTIDRTFVKREYGVGSTAQWRKRIITQIEDRIKDKRHSIFNARRIGMQDSGDTLTTELHQTNMVGATSAAPSVSEEEERVRLWKESAPFKALSQPPLLQELIVYQ